MVTARATTLDRVLREAKESKAIPANGIVLNLGDGMHTRKTFEKAGYKFHHYEALGLRPSEADILFIEPAAPELMFDAFRIFREQAKQGAVLLVLGAETQKYTEFQHTVNETYTVYRK
jgi:hypothetical protein